DVIDRTFRENDARALIAGNEIALTRRGPADRVEAGDCEECSQVVFEDFGADTAFAVGDRGSTRRVGADAVGLNQVPRSAQTEDAQIGVAGDNVTGARQADYVVIRRQDLDPDRSVGQGGIR